MPPKGWAAATAEFERRVHTFASSGFWSFDLRSVGRKGILSPSHVTDYVTQLILIPSLVILEDPYYHEVIVTCFLIENGGYDRPWNTLK